MSEKRDGFSSRFGIIAAAAGSAIGLGNIWKFPYITGLNGGGAFIAVYLLCIVMIGLPILISEMLIGRKSRTNAFDGFAKISGKKGWRVPGGVTMATAFIILSFYCVIAGWTLKYIMLSVGHSFAGRTPEEVTNIFTGFITSPVEPIIYQIVFLIITGFVVLSGVHNGIERASKFLMPFLVVIILVLNIRAVTLDGASEGLRFLFNPDFSKLTKDGVLEALGHAFFTLSLGMGIMLTYGSYIKEEVSLGATAIQVAIADTVIALLAGVAIFPAVFAFNIEPGAGPGLVFITLPNIFNQMAGGAFFETIFFMLLAIAALTSTVSLMEVPVAYVAEDFKLGRKKATIVVVVALAVVGALFSLSMSPASALSSISINNMNLFDFADYLTANWMLPLVALTVSIFAGWIMSREDVTKEITSNGKFHGNYIKVFFIMIKFISPILIAIVFLNKVFGL